MTDIDKRLDRLYPSLSAQERGILMLLDNKAGRQQDWELRRTTPESQGSEFNHFVDVIRAAGGDLVHLILLQCEMITHTELRLAWLSSLQAIELECSRVREHLLLDLREPITQSTYDARVQSSRADWIPVGECADILAEKGSWPETALDRQDEEQGDTFEIAARLRELVDEGTLTGRGKGARLKISCGSFYDWLGETVPVLPEWGTDIEVYPDERAKEATGLARRRTELLDLIDRLAARRKLPFDLDEPMEPAGEDAFAVELPRTLALGIRAELKCHWVRLLACEIVIDEMTAEFLGEDVLPPEVRHLFDGAKAKLSELHDRAQRYTGPFDLAVQPDREVLAFVRTIVERDVSG